MMEQVRSSDAIAPVIRLENISKSWDNRNVLTNINLNIWPGETLCITGPNGGGKTTLLRILLGLVTPTTGRVAYFDPQTGCAVKRLNIGYLPQKNQIDARFPITVEEVVESGLLARKLSPRARRSLVATQLKALDLTKISTKSIGTLSGGQLQRSLIARALVNDPEIIVLDEPLSYLDHASGERIRSLLTDYSGRKTIIAVTHSMTLFDGLDVRYVTVANTLL